jgi:hypothetical protein
VVAARHVFACVRVFRAVLLLAGFLFLCQCFRSFRRLLARLFLPRPFDLFFGLHRRMVFGGMNLGVDHGPHPRNANVATAMIHGTCLRGCSAERVAAMMPTTSPTKGMSTANR